MLSLTNIVVAVVVFLLLLVVLSLAGVPYAGLIALAVALLAFIANVGSRV